MGDFGMSFGTQNRRNPYSVRMADGGVRSGPKPMRAPRSAGPSAASVMATAAGAGEQAEDVADDARKTAYRAATSGSGGGWGGTSETDDQKAGVLPGGSMGLKPDLSEAERLESEYQSVLAKRSPFKAMWAESAVRAEDDAFRTRIQLAREKAYRDAMQARAENEWVDDDVVESGQIQQVNPLTGKTRLKTVEEKYKEEMEGPPVPGREAPYREAMRQAPVLDKNIAERKMIGTQQAEKDTREAEEAKAKTARDLEAEKEIERLKDTLMSGRATNEANLRKEIARLEASLKKDVATHESGLPARPRATNDPYATPQGERTALSALRESVLSGLGFASEQDFSENATEQDRAAYKTAITEAMKAAPRPRGQNQTPMGPGGTADYGGEVGPAPAGSAGKPSDGMTRENVRQGVRVREKYNAKTGKWVVTEELG